MEQPAFSRIFISHAVEDQALAEAWQNLLNTMSNGAEQPWYSSDPRAKGGMQPGDWRMQIHQAIEHAETILVLLTPASNERTWPTWESGVAYGSKKEVIPIYLFTDVEHIHDVFKKFECFNGLDKDVVLGLCETILFKDLDVPEHSRVAWGLFYDGYDETVRHEQKQSFTRALFIDTFHNFHLAKTLEGIWDAAWYRDTDKGEELFTEDALQLWTTSNRVRLVGRSTKEGVEERVKLDPTLANYPMEGVVSSAGWIALSYWSAANTPICGTTLLRRQGASWTDLVGTWEGFTAKSFKDEPAFTRGKVTMRKVAETWSDWEDIQEAEKRDDDC